MADVAFAAAQTDFAVGLLREAAAGTNASLILSPISIALALSLAYAGAGGDTRREFERVFARGGNTGDALDAAFHRTWPIGRSSTAKLDVKAAYRELLAANFGAAFQPVNFERRAEEAVREINEFFANATHQKIRDLLSADDVDPDTALVLVNAVYFKVSVRTGLLRRGKLPSSVLFGHKIKKRSNHPFDSVGRWDEAFSERSTTDETFFVDENTERPVKMMKQWLRSRYLETDDVQVLELPYTDERTNVHRLSAQREERTQRKVEGAEVLELMDRLRWREVDVSSECSIELPRFKITADFKLKDVLKRMGLSEGFKGTANFSGISNDPLYIAEGFHKAFIEVTTAFWGGDRAFVDESGSEAAAATALRVEFVSAAFTRSAEEPVRFRADHPFAFLVTCDKQPLFFGRYTGPSV
ncbi:SERPIN domain-containing protein [Aphelenchoides fujianensis]|nr:SERPIN domain-containing protein [Aphelenchoides fujianensis]